MARTQSNLLLLCALVAFTLAAPTSPPSPSASASFDQRQDGKLNVRVDLDNFVILFARPSSSSSLDLFGSVAQLLADSRHSTPVDPNQPQASTSEGTSVDNNKPLEDVTVQVEQTKSHEPGLVLIQFPQHQTEEVSGGKLGRSLQRALKDSRARPRAQQLLEEKFKRLEDVAEPQKLELVGALEPGCGPELERDASGICGFPAAVKQLVQPIVPLASGQL